MNPNKMLQISIVKRGEDNPGGWQNVDGKDRRDEHLYLYMLETKNISLSLLFNLVSAGMFVGIVFAFAFSAERECASFFYCHFLRVRAED